MKSRLLIALSSSLTLLFAGSAFSDVLAYPQKGQSTEQQQKDEYECYAWAKQQTGIDPHNLAGTVPPSGTPQQKGGGAAGGAAKGAAAGAIGGAIGGDAGKGAAIGAGVGGAGGALHRRKQQQQAQQEQQQAQSQQKQQLATFNNAQSLCMKGRGYAVQG